MPNVEAVLVTDLLTGVTAVITLHTVEGFDAAEANAEELLILRGWSGWGSTKLGKNR
jgi:hypothetical protein